MASTIMYKFRSSTSFEPLPMPGNTARLFDVKRAIVTAKKLDRSTNGPQLEFDLSVRNAMTNDEYEDENMLLPRGTRVVVQRLPAAKGHGLLSRIARADAGMGGAGGGGAVPSYGNVAAAQSGYYTINSTKDEEEFVNVEKTQQQQPTVDSSGFENTNQEEDAEEKELAALKAVTDQAGSMYRSNTTLSRSTAPNKFGLGGGVGGVTPSSHGAIHFNKPQFQRPNADPELREQELRQAAQQQPKKRATGIPRTFLNLSAPPPSDNPDSNEGGDGAAKEDANNSDTNENNNTSTVRLQPNLIGFEAIINRGGGQSLSNPASKRRTLDYALKLTATTIPSYLQCGICQNVVKNAMLIPWDTEGRTACEVCMRDGLAQNGFKCPLTGMEGMSPDELHPNPGLRNAAENFVQGVMEKMEKIVQQQQQEEDEAAVRDEEIREREQRELLINKEKKYDGGSLEKGVVVTKKMQQKKKSQADEFGEDDFGGDVFDVSNDEIEGNEDELEENNKVRNNSSKIEYGTTDSAGSMKKNVKQEYDSTATHKRKENASISHNANKSIASSVADDTKSTATSGCNVDDDKQSKNIVSAVDASNTAPPSAFSRTSIPPIQNDNGDKRNDLKPGLSSYQAEEIPQQQSRTKHNSASSMSPTRSLNNSSGTSSSSRRDMLMKNRGPPAGYMMGPAGGASSAVPVVNNSVPGVYSNTGSAAPHSFAGKQQQQQYQQSGAGRVGGGGYDNLSLQNSVYNNNNNNISVNNYDNQNVGYRAGRTGRGRGRGGGGGRFYQNHNKHQFQSYGRGYRNGGRGAYQQHNNGGNRAVGENGAGNVGQAFQQDDQQVYRRNNNINNSNIDNQNVADQNSVGQKGTKRCRDDGDEGKSTSEARQREDFSSRSREPRKEEQNNHRDFRDNWHKNNTGGRGRGFDQQGGRGYGQRGRGDFYAGSRVFHGRGGRGGGYFGGGGRGGQQNYGRGRF